ncbi:ExbD/TolR family protein [Marivita sp. S2033]|uniref:ExbD/TolR family protein n=1 Tax=Marivita sp. S2033 TaxID=3373187 RepID=UPI00398297C9
MTSLLSLSPRPRRASREPVVPMINVVFLLLIFFLMTAQIVPPAPFDLTLPTADGDEDAGDATLYISADGDIAFEALRGDTALVQAAARTDTLRLSADAALNAQTLARLLGELAALGATKVELVTEGG